MESGTTREPPAAVGRLYRLRRVIGLLMVGAGILTILWAVVVWQWNDPATALYTRWEQHQLAGEHARIVAEFKPRTVAARTISPARAEREVARNARRLQLEAPTGAPVGRIVIPRLGVNMLMVNGTSSSVLKRGPGIDGRSFLPGQGQLVYIAGHRTTYLAPFSNIDELRAGDRVTLSMPYGRFDYTVTGHRIVDAHDLSVLKSHGKEVVALQACHPRFFAPQRYIVWAKPTSVTPPGGTTYHPTTG